MFLLFKCIEFNKKNHGFFIGKYLLLCNPLKLIRWHHTHQESYLK